MKLQIWDTAGQERFKTITTAYYRGAMGILLVYDVTNESSFANINTWMSAIRQHASDSVNKVLLGNKADTSGPLVQKRSVATARGQALADQHGIRFFETSAKNGINRGGFLDNCTPHQEAAARRRWRRRRSWRGRGQGQRRRARIQGRERGAPQLAERRQPEDVADPLCTWWVDPRAGHAYGRCSVRQHTYTSRILSSLESVTCPSSRWSSVVVSEVIG